MNKGQESRINRGWLIPLGLLVLLLGVAANLLLSGNNTLFGNRLPVSLKSGTLIPQTRPMAPFSLTDHQGKPFDQESIKGRWHLLSFGYTHCPDICPTTLALLARVDDRLQQQAPGIDIQTIFVSIDPERDSAQVLADYVPYFNRDFIGVTGSPEQLQKLTSQLGVLYARVDSEESAMGYLMDHSASIILFNPEGRFQALFSAPHNVEAMVQDLIDLVGPES